MDTSDNSSTTSSDTEDVQVVIQQTKFKTRKEILGFKPQREDIYSKFLPYADKIDDESLEKLAEIKTNLGRAVVLQEMRPGWEIWIKRLMKYIRLYGFKFSKDDHIVFIKVVYELLTIPGLEPFMVNKFATVLHILLKKKELLLPGGLELPWRPLYDLVERTFNTNAIGIGIYRYTSCLEPTLDKLCHVTRYYYPVTATSEMLEVWKPLMCPHDNQAMSDYIENFDWFLPLCAGPNNAHLSYKLWFDDLINMWNTCNNACVPWEEDVVWVMARLAYNNVGYIDWEPHMSFIFTRFLRSFSLPVHYYKLAASKSHKISIDAMSLWIVSNLGGGSSCQTYLDQLMKAIESYFHPANAGRWSQKLKQLLSKLPYYFVKRLHGERYKTSSYLNEVPSEKKLTEEDITRFVQCLQPIITQSLYSKVSIRETGKALQDLAILRPNIIIPPLIETFYACCDSILEPHKLACIIQYMVAVARTVVQCPEGAIHVIPMMTGLLPHLDTNDFYKCVCTFSFLCTYAVLVPIVNSSDASKYYTLSEEESIICNATAGFEDFVLEFMNRLLSLVESSVLESTRLEREQVNRSSMENLSENLLGSTVGTILGQTSTPIFKAALEKLFSFTTSHILETKVSGRLLTLIWASFSKVNPSLTYQKIIPYLCDTIKDLTSHSDVQKEENLDKELLYNLLVLSGLIYSSDRLLLDYIPMLSEVLDLTLHLTCIEGYTTASKLLLTLFSSLSQIKMVELKSSNKSFDLPTSEYLPIREWGKESNLKNLDVEWYIPGDKELSIVQQLVSKYISKELDNLDQYSNGTKPIDRKDIQRSLSIVVSILGCSSMLPLWDEPVKHLWNTSVPPNQWYLELGENGAVTMPDGSNVRQTLVNKIGALQAKLLEAAEDDTKSFGFIIQIWESLTMKECFKKDQFESHWKSFYYLKKQLENRLIGQKHHIRSVLLIRINLQHQTRLNTSCILMTETHQKILMHLFTLSTSHYTEVRIKAQFKLFKLLESLPFSYLTLIPRILQNLKLDPNLHHEEFKGTLNILLGPKRYPLILRHNWTVLNQLWSTLIRATPSEKLSIVKLIQTIREVVNKQFPTITLTLKVPDSCIEAAKKIWNTSSPPPLCDAPTNEEIIKATQTLETTGKNNVENYDNLLDSLYTAIVNEKLHWRFNQLAFCLLRYSVHPDRHYPENIVKLFLETLINDSIELRKVALRCTLFILKQQKRSHPKIKIDPRAINNKNNIDNSGPGYRSDNIWLQYTPENNATDAQKWDEPRYVQKMFLGYNDWAREIEVYAPSKDQPKLDRTIDELSPVEKHVDFFFSQEFNVEQLIKYFSLEEKKETDKFNGSRMAMFKALFRNFGDKHLSLFKPHIEKLIVEKNETSQRCAAEFIAGLIKGSKHWPFDKVQSLWDWLVPVIRTAFANMTAESVDDWGVCYATACKNRDPNRIHWLLSVLSETSQKEEASFLETGRLFVLHCSMNQFKWRIYHLNSEVYENALIPRLTHDFQNVRDRVSGMLSNIFDLNIPTEGRPPSPHIDEFIERVKVDLIKLYALYDDKHSNGNGNSLINNLSDSLMKTTISDECEQKETDRLIRLLKSVCKCIVGCLLRNIYSGKPCYYELFPLMCLFENYDKDDELRSSCKTAVALLAQALVLPQYIPPVLENIKKVSIMKSWQARMSCLEFINCFLFHNLSTIMSQSNWIDEIYTIVMTLLEDDRVEIREKSGVVLSSLIHIKFIKEPTKLYEKLIKMCRKHFNKKRREMTPSDIRTIHAGIIGLCAFVDASPYDVVDPIPEIFYILGEHLDDPQPITGTIRKSLGDFKRTHHGNWDAHKLKFTEEQLQVLDQLVIPPTYYA